MKKPDNLLYGVEDVPPKWITIVLAFQHLSTIAIALVFPVLIVRAMNGTVEQTERLVAVSMVAGGIGAVLQALKRSPVGSGYLCPSLCGPSFISASMVAVKTGGLSLLFGMTIFASVVEAALSRVISKLRALFPPEVTGLIVAMVGITVIRIGISNLFGIGNGDDVIETAEVVTGISTLLCMIFLNVWGKGKLRLFSILIGMAFGYVLAYILGVLTPQHLSEFSKVSYFSNPIAGHPGWSFDFALVIPFFVAMLCSMLKTIGDLTTCQKINDANWKRTDMKNVSGGVLADAASCFASGLLGGAGQSTSSSNIGLSIASSATSRVIAFAIGGLLVLFAFCPKLACVFAVMPAPVMGATLVFALAFMVVAGIQILSSRMIDNRKTFVIGISMIIGLSVDIVPNIYEGMHPWISPIFSSSLSAAAVIAVVLNMLMRIGIAKKARIEFKIGVDTSSKVFAFMEKQGGIWGARREVITSASSSINEVIEALAYTSSADQPATIEAVFDEFNLDIRISYKGEPMVFPAIQPTHEDLIERTGAVAELAGYLARQHADKVNVMQDGEFSTVHLHFEH